jgi:hypothetical protein
MKDIILGNQGFRLPENWQEVDRRLLPRLLRLLYVLPETGETYHELLRISLGYTPRQWGRLMNHFLGPDRSDAQREASALALADTLNQIGWMWRADLTVRPFASVTAGGEQEWLVFEENFRSMSFGEMTDAYIHAQAYIKQLEAGDRRLDLLIATIARPERAGDYANDPAWNGDRREDYNPHLSTRRAELAGLVPWEQKIGLLMYFIGSAKDFMARFDIWADDGAAPPTEESFPGQSLLKNQHLLSEKGVFGTMKETKAENVYEIFQFLEEHHQDLKQAAAEQAAAERHHQT